MKKLIIVSAAAVSLLAAQASAAVGATGTVTINGNVASNCAFTTGSATITAGELANSGTGFYNGALDATTATLVGFCNGVNATVGVLANPVTTGASAGAGFTNRIDYTATAALTNAAAASVSASDSSVGAAVADNAASALGQFTGNIVVTLSSSAAAGGNKPIAGAYTGTTVVTLTPGL